MKNILMSTLVFLFLTESAFAAQDNKEVEPDQGFLLTINGVSHEVQAGDKYELIISGKKYDVVLTENSTKKFDHAGISFDFNAKLHFSYEALTPTVDHWSLDGNNAVIMIQKYSPKLEYREIFDAIVNQFNQMKADIIQSEVNLVFGGESKKGDRLVIGLGDVKLEQQIYYFSNVDDAVVIIFQDALTDSGANTDEFKNMLDMVQKTLLIKI